MGAGRVAAPRRRRDGSSDAAPDRRGFGIYPGARGAAGGRHAVRMDRLSAPVAAYRRAGGRHRPDAGGAAGTSAGRAHRGARRAALRGSAAGAEALPDLPLRKALRVGQGASARRDFVRLRWAAGARQAEEPRHLRPSHTAFRGAGPGGGGDRPGVRLPTRRGGTSAGLPGRGRRAAPRAQEAAGSSACVSGGRLARGSRRQDFPASRRHAGGRLVGHRLVRIAWRSGLWRGLPPNCRPCWPHCAEARTWCGWTMAPTACCRKSG